MRGEKKKARIGVVVSGMSWKASLALEYARLNQANSVTMRFQPMPVLWLIPRITLGEGRGLDTNAFFLHTYFVYKLIAC